LVKLLAVDLDGTLVDSAPDIAHCLGHALEAVGFAAPGEAATRTWIGDGLETLIARALGTAALAGAPDRTGDPSSLHAEALAAFLACYGTNLFVRSRLYPGATETLDALLGRGVRLCCITNKRHALSEEVLRLAGVRNRFELVLGGDSVAEKKPSPLPLQTAARKLDVPSAEATLVGDARQDLGAARSAGFGFVWASYGYGKLAAGEVGASAVIRSFAELTDVIAAPRR
jgi:phosphoglycolate phosphatase